MQLYPNSENDPDTSTRFHLKLRFPALPAPLFSSGCDSNLNPRAAPPGRPRDPKSQITRGERALEGKYALDLHCFCFLGERFLIVVSVSTYSMRILMVSSVEHSDCCCAWSGFERFCCWNFFLPCRVSHMARVYVGNLDPRVTAREIEDEFRTFGVLKRWDSASFAR